MNYEFPIIRTIDDVLPHIEGREEFVVAEREGYTVINYVVAMDDTFPPVKVAGGSAKMREERALTNAMRRECRGLIFDRDGKIMSRPFHKFFNVNEREETQVNRIDMSKPHVIMEKMDGSMIRPVLVDGYLRLATKMGVTEVAMDAEQWLAKYGFLRIDGKAVASRRDYLRSEIENGRTPIFEWVSPFNQIVLAYEEEDLVYLGSRDNITGEYFFDENAPFTKVPRYGSMDGNILEYIARQRSAEGREGDIIRFADGHMLKVKNDWYVRIHKTIDRITFDRNIVDLIINEEVDDVIPMLPTAQVERIRDFEFRFWAAFKVKEDMLLADRNICLQLFEDDRKRIALEYIPTLKNKADAALIFRMLDGHNVRDVLLQHVEKNITTNVKWEACAKWLGM